MNATSESPDPIDPPDLPNILEEPEPGPRPETGQANPMLTLLDPDSVVPNEAADRTDGDANATDLPAPEPQQNAPADPEDVQDTTGDDQADAPKGTVSPVGQEREDSAQRVQPTGRDSRVSPEPDMLKKRTDRETGPREARDKLTVGIVTGMTIGAFAAHLICFSADPISLSRDRRDYSSLNGPHKL
jgi:hypothetical protein